MLIKISQTSGDASFGKKLSLQALFLFVLSQNFQILEGSLILDKLLKRLSIPLLKLPQVMNLSLKITFPQRYFAFLVFLLGDVCSSPAQRSVIWAAFTLNLFFLPLNLKLRLICNQRYFLIDLFDFLL